MTMNFNELIDKALETTDHSVVKKGGDFKYVPPAEGKGPARLVEYIELGSHVEQYQGKDKPTARQVRVTFELLGKKNIREIEVDGVKREVADRISVTMPVSQSEKSKFYKLFKALAYGREDIKHMAQCLGQAFFVTVKHNDNGKTGDDKRIYANIFYDAVWHVESPIVVDPMTETSVNYGNNGQIRDALTPLRLFLFDIPTKECWDSLFIDGSTETKAADGTVTTKSKNWLQELITSATDYEGSALDQLVHGLGPLPTENKQEDKPADDTPVENKQASADDTDAAMAALGL